MTEWQVDEVVEGELQDFGDANANVHHFTTQTDGTGNSITSNGGSGFYNVVGVIATDTAWYPRILAFAGENWSSVPHVIDVRVTVNSGAIRVSTITCADDDDLAIGETLTAGESKTYQHHFDTLYNGHFNELKFSGQVETTYDVDVEFITRELTTTTQRKERRVHKYKEDGSINKYLIDNVLQDYTPTAPTSVVADDTAIIGYADTIKQEECDLVVRTVIETDEESTATFEAWLIENDYALTENGEVLRDEFGVILWTYE